MPTRRASRALRALIIDPVLHRYGSPTLYEMEAAGGILHHDVPGFLGSLLSDSGLTIGELMREYDEARGELSRRQASGDSPAYPDHFDAGPRSALAIYALVRLAGPRTVLETGVANGHTSFFILQALRRNGTGTLRSIDIRNDVASCLTAEERAAWHLVELDQRHLAASFRLVVRGLGDVDLFIHDSDHSYRWQMLEYRTLWCHLRTGALLVSDDVDSSRAFIDFCRCSGVTPNLLVDQRTVLGAVRVAASGQTID